MFQDIPKGRYVFEGGMTCRCCGFVTTTKNMGQHWTDKHHKISTKGKDGVITILTSVLPLYLPILEPEERKTGRLISQYLLPGQTVISPGECLCQAMCMAILDFQLGFISEDALRRAWFNILVASYPFSGGPINGSVNQAGLYKPRAFKDMQRFQMIELVTLLVKQGKESKNPILLVM